MSASGEIAGRLAAWPRGFQGDLKSVVRESLAACNATFAAAASVLEWEEREEPGVFAARLEGDRFDWIEARDDRYVPAVSPERADQTFVAESGEHLSPALWRELLRGRVLTFPVNGAVVEGRCFVCDASIGGDDAGVWTPIVASLLACRVDAAVHSEAALRHAVADQNRRVARDLHDGLLQSFTGIVLQLETAHAVVATDPDQAAHIITEAQAAIMSDQRDLRSFVESLRPALPHAAVPFDFNTRMEEARQRFVGQWGIEVALDSARLDPRLGAALGQETYRIVQEALTNAARHGSPSRIDVALQTTDSALLIRVRDDGEGLPVPGRLTLAALRERGIAPHSLAERVEALNGELLIESGDAGTAIEITIPVGWLREEAR